MRSAAIRLAYFIVMSLDTMQHNRHWPLPFCTKLCNLEDDLYNKREEELEQ